MLKIRRRERIDSSPPEGMRQEWVEYQVVDGRKIIARCGTRPEAEQRLFDLADPVQQMGIRNLET